MQVATNMDNETEMTVKRLSVPLGLEELMESLAKEVLRKKPNDIYTFASDHFAHLLVLRDTGSYKAPAKKTKKVSPQISKENIDELYITGREPIKIKAATFGTVTKISKSQRIKSPAPRSFIKSTKKNEEAKEMNISPIIRNRYIESPTLKSDKAKQILEKRKAKKLAIGDSNRTENGKHIEALQGKPFKTEMQRKYGTKKTSDLKDQNKSNDIKNDKADRKHQQVDGKNEVSAKGGKLGISQDNKIQLKRDKSQTKGLTLDGKHIVGILKGSEIITLRKSLNGEQMEFPSGEKINNMTERFKKSKSVDEKEIKSNDLEKEVISELRNEVNQGVDERIENDDAKKFDKVQRNEGPEMQQKSVSDDISDEQYDSSTIVNASVDEEKHAIVDSTHQCKADVKDINDDNVLNELNNKERDEISDINKKENVEVKTDVTPISDGKVSITQGDISQTSIKDADGDITWKALETAASRTDEVSLSEEFSLKPTEFDNKIEESPMSEADNVETIHKSKNNLNDEEIKVNDKIGLHKTDTVPQKQENENEVLDSESNHTDINDKHEVGAADYGFISDAKSENAPKIVMKVSIKEQDNAAVENEPEALESTNNTIESGNSYKLENAAVTIQAIIRGYLARNIFKYKLKEAANIKVARSTESSKEGEKVLNILTKGYSKADMTLVDNLEINSELSSSHKNVINIDKENVTTNDFFLTPATDLVDAKIRDDRVKESEIAAITIQAVIRGFLVRRKLKHNSKTKLPDIADKFESKKEEASEKDINKEDNNQKNNDENNNDHKDLTDTSKAFTTELFNNSKLSNEKNSENSIDEAETQDRPFETDVNSGNFRKTFVEALEDSDQSENISNKSALEATDQSQSDVSQNESTSNTYNINSNESNAINELPYKQLTRSFVQNEQANYQTSDVIKITAPKEAKETEIVKKYQENQVVEPEILTKTVDDIESEVKNLGLEMRDTDQGYYLKETKSFIETEQLHYQPESTNENISNWKHLELAEENLVTKEHIIAEKLKTNEVSKLENIKEEPMLKHADTTVGVDETIKKNNDGTTKENMDNCKSSQVKVEAPVIEKLTTFPSNEEDAAIKIQSAWRVHRIRRHIKKSELKDLQRPPECDEIPKQNDAFTAEDAMKAATIIQALFRGYSVRKHFSDKTAKSILKKKSFEEKLPTVLEVDDENISTAAATKQMPAGENSTEFSDANFKTDNNMNERKEILENEAIENAEIKTTADEDNKIKESIYQDNLQTESVNKTGKNKMHQVSYEESEENPKGVDVTSALVAKLEALQNENEKTSFDKVEDIQTDALDTHQKGVTKELNDDEILAVLKQLDRVPIPPESPLAVTQRQQINDSLSSRTLTRSVTVEEPPLEMKYIAPLKKSTSISHSFVEDTANLDLLDPKKELEKEEIAMLKEKDTDSAKTIDKELEDTSDEEKGKIEEKQSDKQSIKDSQIKAEVKDKFDAHIVEGNEFLEHKNVSKIGFENQTEALNQAKEIEHQIVNDKTVSADEGRNQNEKDDFSTSKNITATNDVSIQGTIVKKEIEINKLDYPKEGDKEVSENLNEDIAEITSSIKQDVVKLGEVLGNIVVTKQEENIITEDAHLLEITNSIKKDVEKLQLELGDNTQQQDRIGNKIIDDDEDEDKNKPDLSNITDASEDDIPFSSDIDSSRTCEADVKENLNLGEVTIHKDALATESEILESSSRPVSKDSTTSADSVDTIIYKGDSETVAELESKVDDKSVPQNFLILNHKFSDADADAESYILNSDPHVTSNEIEEIKSEGTSEEKVEDNYNTPKSIVNKTVTEIGKEPDADSLPQHQQQQLHQTAPVIDTHKDINTYDELMESISNTREIDSTEKSQKEKEENIANVENEKKIDEVKEQGNHLVTDVIDTAEKKIHKFFKDDKKSIESIEEVPEADEKLKQITEDLLQSESHSNANAENIDTRNPVDKDAAATTIQKTYKGYRVRRDLQSQNSLGYDLDLDKKESNIDAEITNLLKSITEPIRRAFSADVTTRAEESGDNVEKTREDEPNYVYIPLRDYSSEDKTVDIHVNVLKRTEDDTETSKMSTKIEKSDQSHTVTDPLLDSHSAEELNDQRKSIENKLEFDSTSKLPTEVVKNEDLTVGEDLVNKSVKVNELNAYQGYKGEVTSDKIQSGKSAAGRKNEEQLCLKEVPTEVHSDIKQVDAPENVADAGVINENVLSESDDIQKSRREMKEEKTLETEEPTLQSEDRNKRKHMHFLVAEAAPENSMPSKDFTDKMFSDDDSKSEQRSQIKQKDGDSRNEEGGQINEEGREMPSSTNAVEKLPVKGEVEAKALKIESKDLESKLTTASKDDLDEKTEDILEQEQKFTKSSKDNYVEDLKNNPKRKVSKSTDGKQEEIRENIDAEISEYINSIIAPIKRAFSANKNTSLKDIDSTAPAPDKEQTVSIYIPLRDYSRESVGDKDLLSTEVHKKDESEGNTAETFNIEKLVSPDNKLPIESINGGSIKEDIEVLVHESERNKPEHSIVKQNITELETVKIQETPTDAEEEIKDEEKGVRNPKLVKTGSSKLLEFSQKIPPLAQTPSQEVTDLGTNVDTKNDFKDVDLSNDSTVMGREELKLPDIKQDVVVRKNGIEDDIGDEEKHLANTNEKIKDKNLDIKVETGSEIKDADENTSSKLIDRESLQLSNYVQEPAEVDKRVSTDNVQKPSMDLKEVAKSKELDISAMKDEIKYVDSSIGSNLFGNEHLRTSHDGEKSTNHIPNGTENLTDNIKSLMEANKEMAGGVTIAEAGNEMNNVDKATNSNSTENENFKLFTDVEKPLEVKEGDDNDVQKLIVDMTKVMQDKNVGSSTGIKEDEHIVIDNASKVTDAEIFKTQNGVEREAVVSQNISEEGRSADNKTATNSSEITAEKQVDDLITDLKYTDNQSLKLKQLDGMKNQNMDEKEPTGSSDEQIEMALSQQNALPPDHDVHEDKDNHSKADSAIQMQEVSADNNDLSGTAADDRDLADNLQESQPENTPNELEGQIKNPNEVSNDIERAGIGDQQTTIVADLGELKDEKESLKLKEITPEEGEKTVLASNDKNKEIQDSKMVPKIDDITKTEVKEFDLSRIAGQSKDGIENTTVELVSGDGLHLSNQDNLSKNAVSSLAELDKVVEQSVTELQEGASGDRDNKELGVDFADNIGDIKRATLKEVTKVLTENETNKSVSSTESDAQQKELEKINDVKVQEIKPIANTGPDSRMDAKVELDFIKDTSMYELSHKSDIKRESEELPGNKMDMNTADATLQLTTGDDLVDSIEKTLYETDKHVEIGNIDNGKQETSMSQNIKETETAEAKSEPFYLHQESYNKASATSQEKAFAEALKNASSDLTAKPHVVDDGERLLHSSEFHDLITLEGSDPKAKPHVADDGEGLLHSSEFHDSIPLEGYSEKFGKTQKINEVTQRTTTRGPSSPSAPTVLVHSGELHDNILPLALQMNDAPGAEIVTSKTEASVSVDAQASNDDVSASKDAPDATHSQADSGMETEKRKNSTIVKKNMEAQAATKIQASFRGYQVRKQLKNRNAGGNITSTRRSARRKSSGRIADAKRANQNKNPSKLEEESATKIQAGIRGFLVRRRQKKEKKNPKPQSA